jgi:hypothetical protein
MLVRSAKAIQIHSSALILPFSALTVTEVPLKAQQVPNTVQPLRCHQIGLSVGRSNASTFFTE